MASSTDIGELEDEAKAMRSTLHRIEYLVSQGFLSSDEATSKRRDVMHTFCLAPMIEQRRRIREESTAVANFQLGGNNPSAASSGSSPERFWTKKTSQVLLDEEHVNGHDEDVRWNQPKRPKPSRDIAPEHSGHEQGLDSNVESTLPSSLPAADDATEPDDVDPATGGGHEHHTGTILMRMSPFLQSDRYLTSSCANSSPRISPSSPARGHRVIPPERDIGMRSNEDMTPSLLDGDREGTEHAHGEYAAVTSMEAQAGIDPESARRCCDADGCTKAACFGVDGSKARSCGAHRTPDMIDVVNLRRFPCNAEGCCRQAYYNEPGRNRSKAKYCSTHKLPTMINVRHRLCAADGCGKTPTYALAGDKPRFCAMHKLKGMVDTKSKTCDFVHPGGDKCTRCRLYGVPDGKATFCLSHKQEGMINIRQARKRLKKL